MGGTRPRTRLDALSRALVAVGPHAGAHRVALRAGVSVLVPLVVLAATGHQEWSIYAAFGAIASLYGRTHVGISRLRMQLTLAVLLTLATAGGELMVHLVAPVPAGVLLLDRGVETGIGVLVGVVVGYVARPRAAPTTV